MLNQTVIVRTATFELTSYGRGLSYQLKDCDSEQAIFLQGDDASQFREEMEAMEDARPEESFELILNELWDRYSEIAEAVL